MRPWEYIVASYKAHEVLPPPTTPMQWLRWNMECRRWPQPPRYFLRFCVLAMVLGFLVCDPGQDLEAGRWRLRFWRPCYRPGLRWALRYTLTGRSA